MRGFEAQQQSLSAQPATLEPAFTSEAQNLAEGSGKISPSKPLELLENNSAAQNQSPGLVQEEESERQSGEREMKRQRVRWPCLGIRAG